MERRRSASRDREALARQDMLTDREKSAKARERAAKHARQLDIECLERELEWERRQKECVQRQEMVSELRNEEKRLCLNERESRGRPDQPRWKRKDIRYEDDPKEARARHQKKTIAAIKYKAILEDEMISRERAELANLSRIQKWRSESEVRANKSQEYQEKKEVAKKVREDLTIMKETTLRDEIVQKDTVYSKNKEAIKKHMSEWVEDHKRRQSSRSIEVEKRRASIDEIKRKQKEYLHQVFEERAAMVLQFKCEFEKSKKEYFRQKVVEHDESIFQKRRNAELIKVNSCNN